MADSTRGADAGQGYCQGLILGRVAKQALARADLLPDGSGPSAGPAAAPGSVHPGRLGGGQHRLGGAYGQGAPHRLAPNTFTPADRRARRRSRAKVEDSRVLQGLQRDARVLRQPVQAGVCPARDKSSRVSQFSVVMFRRLPRR